MESNEEVRAEETVEDIVNKINNINYGVNGITLSMTADLMLSNDYKIRFLAEYIQCKIRYNKLHETIVKMDAGTLNFVPDSPRLVLANQKSAMGNYLNQLEIRAEIEKIPLPHM